MAWKFEKTCPKCGSHLILREGRKGEFLACPRFPRCKYSEPVTDDNIKSYSPPSPFCEKCNHTGLLPFVKNGRVIPFAWLDCECRTRQPEHYHRFSPEDIDFPVSWDFHRMYSVINELPDPGDNEAPAIRPALEPEPSPDYRKVEGQITALRAMIQDVQKQNQRVKKPIAQKKDTTQGIEI